VRNKFVILLLSAVVTGFIFGTTLYAKSDGDGITPAQHNEERLTLAQIAKIQPGLGTVMLEYSYRFYVLYYAAKAENWDLAQYELKEQIEIQEVAEVTRPNHADRLRAFEHTYLDKISKAIEAKEWNAFKNAYAAAIDGCNACHVETGHSYIKYRLPSTPPELLRMTIK
jgi:hypothetical protein